MQPRQPALVILRRSMYTMATQATLHAVLRASRPFVAKHGFTLDAVRAGQSVSQQSQPAVDVDVLFSTPVEATERLLADFDRHGLESARTSLRPFPASSVQAHRQQHDRQAAERAALLLAGKLLHSAHVRDQLTDVSAMSVVLRR